MSYMILGGTFIVPVLSDSGEATEPYVSGGDVESYDGSLRTTRRVTKRRWRRRTKRMTTADLTALRAIIGSPMGGNIVAVTGTIVQGVSTSCLVIIEGIEDIKQTTSEIRYKLTLFLKEV